MRNSDVTDFLLPVGALGHDYAKRASERLTEGHVRVDVRVEVDSASLSEFVFVLRVKQSASASMRPAVPCHGRTAGDGIAVADFGATYFFPRFAAANRVPPLRFFFFHTALQFRIAPSYSESPTFRARVQREHATAIGAPGIPDCPKPQRHRTGERCARMLAHPSLR
jgi:hypothetical protein